MCMREKPRRGMGCISPWAFAASARGTAISTATPTAAAAFIAKPTGVAIASPTDGCSMSKSPTAIRLHDVAEGGGGKPRVPKSMPEPLRTLCVHITLLPMGHTSCGYSRHGGALNCRRELGRHNRCRHNTATLEQRSEAGGGVPIGIETNSKNAQLRAIRIECRQLDLAGPHGVEQTVASARQVPPVGRIRRGRSTGPGNECIRTVQLVHWRMPWACPRGHRNAKEKNPKQEGGDWTLRGTVSRRQARSPFLL